MDPLDVLAGMNPVSDLGLLAPTRTYVPAQRTLQRILQRPLPEVVADELGRPRRRRPRWALVAAAAGAVAVVAAAATVVIASHPDDPASIQCFASPQLSGDVAVVRATEGVAPVEACADVWRIGTFRPWSGGLAPALSACVLDNGSIGVFPGEPEVCDRLSLPRVATDGDPSATVRVVQLIDNLKAALAAPRCVDVASAADLVRGQLDQLGLVGWTLIAPASTEQGRPCASILFDPPARTLTLVPIPVPATS